MSPDQLNALQEDVRYIREKVDDHGKELTDLRVSVEHRLTKVEVKAGFWGALSGALSTLGVSWFRGH